MVRFLIILGKYDTFMLIPYMNLCKQSSLSNRLTNNFELFIEKGKINLQIQNDFNESEFTLNYLRGNKIYNNENLILYNGFYSEDNYYDYTNVLFEVNKSSLTTNKKNILLQSKMIPDLVQFLNSVSNDKLFTFSINRKDILNPNLLTVAKLINLNENEVDLSEATMRIFGSGKYSYDNEISSLSHIRKNVLKYHLITPKISFLAVLKSLSQTLLTSEIQGNKKEYAKFMRRKNILETNRLSRKMIISSLEKIDESIVSLTSDQLMKLKKYYIN